MRETEHFINEGYGWTCKHCLAGTPPPSTPHERARFFTEGEAEDRETRFSAPALARWRDASRQTLYCPRCGAEERVKDEA